MEDPQTTPAPGGPLTSFREARPSRTAKATRVGWVGFTNPDSDRSERVAGPCQAGGDFASIGRPRPGIGMPVRPHRNACARASAVRARAIRCPRDPAPRPRHPMGMPARTPGNGCAPPPSPSRDPPSCSREGHGRSRASTSTPSVTHRGARRPPENARTPRRTDESAIRISHPNCNQRSPGKRSAPGALGLVPARSDPSLVQRIRRRLDADQAQFAAR